MRFTLTLLVATALGCANESTTTDSDPIAVSEVQAITLVSWGYTLDGGTMTLFAKTDSDENCTIVLNQHVDSTYPNPGRLFFNGTMIDVRSEDESRIIELLRVASVDPIEVPDSENQNFDNALIIGDDIKDVLNSSAEENLHKFRDSIIAFVESDEYVRISQEGL